MSKSDEGATVVEGEDKGEKWEKSHAGGKERVCGVFITIGNRYESRIGTGGKGSEKPVNRKIKC